MHYSTLYHFLPYFATTVVDFNVVNEYFLSLVILSKEKRICDGNLCVNKI